MSNSNMKMIKKDDGDDDRIIKAIIEEELVRGREFANQLRQLIVINKTNNNNEVNSAYHHNHLLSNVISSFANTLSLLNKYPIHPINQSSSSSSSPNNNDDLMQMQPPQPQQLHSRLLTYDQHICSTQPDRRGSYRRKRNMETWTEESEKEREEDGHQWRKYGQKAIQKEKYTRNYFRCTHKYEQGCQATKQVQKLQENPPLYRTTYYGCHTCTNLDTNNHILIMEEDGPNNTSSSSIFLSFDNSLPNPPTNPFFSSTTTQPPPPKMMKEEEDKEVGPSSSTHPVLDDSSNNNNSNICWEDLMMMMVMSHQEALYGFVDDEK
ncbi:hypothetical protein PIB30_036993 [Stylosanthes scabra]|uniref:WRKY domain-containing protein n=1 Tax=Stylosanthes scabra TaxID=79078 RepID=A0ABU6ZAF7_9FABA|nr:hypothetical protein [Stylosanthes scabra]